MKNIKCLKPDLKSELTNHYVRLPKSNFECLKAQNKLFSFKYIKLICCEVTLFATCKFWIPQTYHKVKNMNWNWIG